MKVGQHDSCVAVLCTHGRVECPGVNGDSRNVPQFFERMEIGERSVCPQFSRADLCRRLGRTPEARASYEKAFALVPQEPERRFLR